MRIPPLSSGNMGRGARLAKALALVAALAGCASLSKNECLTADWRRIGETDGARGRLPGHLDAHREACARVGVVPDAAAWDAGRAEGLRGYCTPRNAFAAAARGGALNPVCGGFDEQALAAAEAEGLEVWLVRERQRRIERSIWRREREIAALVPRAKTDPAAAKRIRGLRRDIRRLELDAALGGVGPGFGGFLFLDP